MKVSLGFTDLLALGPPLVLRKEEWPEEVAERDDRDDPLGKTVPLVDLKGKKEDENILM